MSLAIRTAPIIAPGMGATLADPWAEKVVTQWLSVLDDEARKTTAKFTKFINSPLGEIGGNPTAQKRWANRAAAAHGASLLGVKIEVGTRARYVAIVDFWKPMAATRSIEEDARRFDTGARCPPAWLYGLRVTIEKHGISSKTRTDFFVVASLTKHALIRLVQRGACHNAHDLSASLEGMWPALSLAEALTRNVRENFAGDVWLIPATIPTQDAPVVLVTAGPTSRDHEFLFYVKTVLRLDMLTPAQLGPVTKLYELLASHSSAELISDRRGEAEAAFESCRNLRRMN